MPSTRKSLIAPHLQALVPYLPGKPIEETEREYGITGITKLASNENCLGPSLRAVEAAQKAHRQAHLYPDAGAYFLKARLLRLHADSGATAAHFVIGNGTNELITLLVRALVDEGEAVVIGWPSFVCYRIAAKACNRTEIAVPLLGDLRYDLDAMAAAISGDPRVKLVFLANPNNPTGQSFGKEELALFLARIPDDVIVVLDEAYAEYATRSDYPDGIGLAVKRPRTVTLRTFSKIHGLAAFRVGYAVCDPEIAAVLEKLRDPFNVNLPGQAAAIAALDDVEHSSRSRSHVVDELPRLVAALHARGFTTTPSQGNFVLAHRGADHPTIPDLVEGLLRRGVIIRPVANYGLTDAVRITVGTVDECAKLLAALDDFLSTSKRDARAGGARG